MRRPEQILYPGGSGVWGAGLFRCNDLQLKTPKPAISAFFDRN
jgi:hypothetical protein